MAIFDLYSKRQKRLRGEIPEVYTYDVIPNALRVQIVHIIKDFIGTAKFGDQYDFSPEKGYALIHDALCREYGLFSLGNEGSIEERVLNNFLKQKDTDKVIDLIELIFRYTIVIDTHPKEYDYYNKVKISPTEAISELNDRLKEHGVGFQFENNQIIKVDSTFIHSEITKPTLTLLWNEKFSGPNDEYLKAHEHYQHGRNKECLVECLKALKVP